MTGDATRLGVVNLNGCHGADLGLLDVEEARQILVTVAVVDARCHGLLDIMGRGVNNREEQQSVC
jgi:hypothetical protein